MLLYGLLRYLEEVVVILRQYPCICIREMRKLKKKKTASSGQDSNLRIVVMQVNKPLQRHFRKMKECRPLQRLRYASPQ